MNIPEVLPIVNNVAFDLYDDLGLLVVKSATFVSLLLSRDVVKKIGLPIKEFFIWADDYEYTKRITDNGYIGLIAQDSTVYHKQDEPKNSVVDILKDKKENAWKYFYYFRNNLYVRKQKGLIKYLFHLAYALLVQNLQIIRYRKDAKLNYIWADIKGSLCSLFFNPKPEMIKEE